MVHKPKFRSQEEEQRFYIAAGQIAVHWGPIELAIENHIIILRNKLGYGIVKGKKDWDRQFPVSFAKKLDELRLHLKSKSLLAPSNQYLRPLLTRCSELHGIRGLVLHSICQGTNLKGKVIFGFSDQKRLLAYTQKEVTISLLEKDLSRNVGNAASVI